MTEQSFALIPFPAPDMPDVSITGSISLRQHLLRVHYTLNGHIESIVLPSRSEHPRRKDDLWMESCFECFLAIPDQSGYWELNFSPSRNWNAYRMDAYRRVGFREESSIEQVQIETQKERPDVFGLTASIDLKRLFQQDILLQAGITAIIQTKNSIETYWALSHPASQADFHIRETFILRLEDRNRPV